MTAVADGPVTTTVTDAVLAALGTVVDPELDEPITDLNFVRSILIDDDGVTVHLRLPTSFCSPSFAYLMASDAQDALHQIDDIGLVRVLLDDHHDSDKINAGLAAEAGYVGTFGAEADDSLDELREIFVRKAHTAAMERCVSALLASGEVTIADLGHLTVRDLPPGPAKAALLRRRVNAGLSLCPNSLVLVDDDGHPVARDDIAMALRFARSVRISIEGNGHFCRGLLATRYADDADCDGRSGPVITDLRSPRRTS
ncbi:MAG: metal-sulfur cluster biosynthetic enzyme [Gordonia sp.]|jgi:metal-sulfur cluster biosynthetic enzyme|uniref:iron-sulfur cluster assembly protein n=1 Tax=Gordonia sp. (in: high G+C Gram-positive bacteria) TaxID=84139 RepID=UPI000C6B18B0|nr:iron-sulfur cluster assembly protein [Gordonia sp. (in: high G+C Gram-positive bacteria)]MAU84700.1 metal-sulfur cluster biosynthetic enzyme [Gordonia sp. (in: high G+C Gram-positive bacteria)]